MHKMTQFHIIGPGRLGLALAKSLMNLPNYELVNIYHPSIAAAKSACEALGAGEPVDNYANLEHCDITFITAPDDAIKEIAKALALNPPSDYVFHCSGIQSAQALAPLAKQNVCIGSMHPLKAFRKDSYLESNPFQDVNCAIEGEFELLTQLVKHLGGHAFSIDANQKALYHTAAIMASNYQVSLAHEACAHLVKAGLGEEEALRLTTMLMQTSLDNLKAVDMPELALTGPLARGDISTVQKHLEALKAPEERVLYRALAHKTLSITSLSHDTIAALEELLEQP